MFKVWSEISEAYKILKIAERFTNITINQFTNGEKPWSQKPLLKGKAAELRHLAPVLALVAWNKAKRPAGTLAQEGAWNKAKETQVALHIAEALTSLACFYDILAGADVFLTNEQAMEACNKAKKCLQHYVWLKAAIDDDLRWQLSPKFHFFYHLAHLAKWQNPRSFWTYGNESWVGQMATLAHSCSHGTRATKLTDSFCQKYLLGYQLGINDFL